VRLLNKLFYDTPAYSSAAHHPRMNVWASDQKVVVHALAPGVDKKEIDIEICGQNLVIEISCSPAAPGCPTEQHSRGSARSIALPFPC
jgi:HSP20 family molecular chaperone IbpA